MVDNNFPDNKEPNYDFLTTSTMDSEVEQERLIGKPFQTGDAGSDSGQNSQAIAKKPKRLKRILVEWVIVILIAVVVAFIARSYVAQTFFIPSGSMSPTLQVGDRILVNKLYGTIHVGDIIVFRRADKDPQVQFPDLVKRVIGLPGQRITWQGNSFTVNGHSLYQPWLPQLTGICATVPNTSGSLVVPKNEYFVMGDCRGDSYDSRYWGPVPASHIIGKVTAIIWRHGSPYFHWF